MQGNKLVMILVFIGLLVWLSAFPVSVQATSNAAPSEKLHDVTSVGLSKVSGVDDFDYGVTYRPDEDAEWGKKSAAQITVHVHNWQQLYRAIMNGFVAADGLDPVDGVAYSEKNNADYIILMNDIVSGNYASGLTRYYASSSRRDYVIDGNGHQLDTGAYAFSFAEGFTPHNVYIKNITMYATNPYGCVMSAEGNGNFTTITYEDVTFIGSQITASFTATLYFRGTNDVRSVNTYTATFENVNNTGTNSTATRGTYANQGGLETHRVIFDKDSATNFDVLNGDGLIMGGYRSTEVTAAGRSVPYVAVRENAQLTMKSRGNAGESHAFNVGTSATLYAGVNLQNGGQLYVGKNAAMTVDTTGTTRAGMRLTTATSARKPAAKIAKEGRLQFNMNGNMNNATAYYSGLLLEGGGSLSIYDQGYLGLSMSNEKNARPALQMSNNSTVNIDSGGILDIAMKGATGRGVQLGTQSVFNVQDFGQVKLQLSEQGTASTSAIHISSGTITVGKQGIMDLKIVDGTAARSMLYIQSGSCSLSEAQRVDLDAQGNDAVRLIDMNSTFNVDIQGIYAWKKGNKTVALDAADYRWTPIYNGQITYARSGNTVSTSKVTAESLTTNISGRFISEYRTENFNRVLFTALPDVELQLALVSDNEALLSGQQFSGKTNPAAMVTFYYLARESGSEIKVPNANEPNVTEGWENDAAKNYHVRADEFGNFRFTFPEAFVVYVGDQIRATAILDGKEVSMTVTVLDKTAPVVTATREVYAAVGGEQPAPADFIQSVTDKGVEPALWKAAFQPAAAVGMETWLKTPGAYTVHLDVADQAIDENGATVPNKNAADVPWKSTLHVLAANKEITADAVIMSADELKALESEAALKEAILQHSNKKAYKLNGYQYVDLTDKVQVTDLGGLSTASKAGVYKVELSVPDEDLRTVIDVKIVGDATLTINFVDRKGEALADPVSFNEYFVGDTVDLSGKSEIAEVIRQLEAARYQVYQRPDKETIYLITDEDETVTYVFDGTLSFYSVPSKIDFGLRNVIHEDIRVDTPTYTDDFVIWDNRYQRQSWQLTVQLETPLMNQTTGAGVVYDALRYQKDTDEVILNNGAQVIVTRQQNGDKFNLTDEWHREGTGLKLEIPAGSVNGLGRYQAKLLWILGDTP